MRIRDWSSDVCSSDLAVAKIEGKPLWRLLAERYNDGAYDETVMVYPGGGYYYPGKGLDRLKDEMRGYRDQGYRVVKMKIGGAESGRASCRERVCQYVYISVVAVSLKKKRLNIPICISKYSNRNTIITMSQNNSEQ